MALSTFFKVNLPYGLKRNADNKWMVFNREYIPIGWSSTQQSESIYSENAYGTLPVYTEYEGLTQELIESLAVNSDAIHSNEKGEITAFFLYNDSTNPILNSEHWDAYWKKIRQLSELRVK